MQECGQVLNFALAGEGRYPESVLKTLIWVRNSGAVGYVTNNYLSLSCPCNYEYSLANCSFSIRVQMLFYFIGMDLYFFCQTGFNRTITVALNHHRL